MLRALAKLSTCADPRQCAMLDLESDEQRLLEIEVKRHCSEFGSVASTFDTWSDGTLR